MTSAPGIPGRAILYALIQEVPSGTKSLWWLCR
jgi:hypothetical protein